MTTIAARRGSSVECAIRDIGQITYSLTSLTPEPIYTKDIRKGVKYSWFDISNAGPSSLNNFTVETKVHADSNWAILASSAEDYVASSNMQYPVKGASEEFPTLSSTVNGVLCIETEGINYLRFQASVGGGTSDLTISYCTG